MLVLSNGNSFSRGEGTEREAPLWRFVLRVVDDRPLAKALPGDGGPAPARRGERGDRG